MPTLCQCAIFWTYICQVLSTFLSEITLFSKSSQKTLRSSYLLHQVFHLLVVPFPSRKKVVDLHMILNDLWFHEKSIRNNNKIMSHIHLVIINLELFLKAGLILTIWTGSKSKNTFSREKQPFKRALTISRAKLSWMWMQNLLDCRVFPEFRILLTLLTSMESYSARPR